MNNLWILVILAVLIIVCMFIIFMKMSDIEDDISIVNCTMYRDRGNIPSRENTEPSSTEKKSILNISQNGKLISAHKKDNPSINVYKDMRIIEIETNKTNIILGVNSFDYIEYDPDECDIYYQ
ncbi:hypothetical protein COSHB9_01910 [Companilactobacillus alimentarius]